MSDKKDGRIFPYANVKRRRARSQDIPEFEPFTAPLPCVIGHQSKRKDELVIRWIAFNPWDIAAIRDRTKATVFSTQAATESILNLCTYYNAYRGLFIEPA